MMACMPKAMDQRRWIDGADKSGTAVYGADEVQWETTNMTNGGRKVSLRHDARVGKD